jgi:hypothetical protein
MTNQVSFEGEDQSVPQLQWSSRRRQAPPTRTDASESSGGGTSRATSTAADPAVRGRRVPRRPLATAGIVGAVVAVLAAAGAPAAVAGKLPDGRAYELVSPPEKSGGMVAFPTGPPGYGTGPATPGAWNQASADGNAAMYFAYASFANPNTGMPASYKATRGPSGWSSTMWTPMPATPHRSLYEGYSTVIGMNDDFTLGFLQVDSPFDPDDQDFAGAYTGTGNDVYSTAGTDESLTWLSRPNTPGPDAVQKQARFVGNSADGSHAFFQTTEALVPEADSHVAGSSLYERVGGTTRLVSVGNDGSALNDCGSILGSYTYNRLFDSASDPDIQVAQNFVVNGVHNAVSGDGNSVYLTSPDPFSRTVDPSCAAPFQVYLRRNGHETIEVSKSQRAVPDTPKPAVFLWASKDGSKVFFESRAALTDDAVPNQPGQPGMLYEYDVDSGTLTLLTKGNLRIQEADVGVGGIVGSSDDASTVYVLLVDGAHPELVAYTGGTVRVIAPFSAMDNGLLFGRRAARVSPDGRFFTFITSENLTTFDTHGKEQVYLYDRDDESLRCVSCVEGIVPTSSASFGSDQASSTLIAFPEPRTLTPDGQVFFQTDDGLVPGDDNGAPDVYGWRNGKLSLISDGREQKGSWLFDVSGDGRDVFFGTTANLVPQDGGNGDSDIYDARIGGGFGVPSVSPPCVGDQCQGVPTAPPVATPVGSADLVGDGNVTPVAGPVKASVSVTKPKAVTGSAGSLKVRVPAAGRVSVSGSGVASKSVSAAKAGSYSVRVALTAKAKRNLKQRKKLTVKVRVSYRMTDGQTATKTVSVAFKQPVAKRAATRKGGR